MGRWWVLAVVALLMALPNQAMLYETGTANATSSVLIGLGAEDGTENQVSYSIAGGSVSTAVNATMVLGGAGLLLRGAVNFSGTFSQSHNNAFKVTWKLFQATPSGSNLLCQHGDDGNGGTQVPGTAKQNVTGNCTAQARLQGGDNLTLSVNLYNTAGAGRTFTHYWDSGGSYVQYEGISLGAIATGFVNATDTRIPEGSSYNETCSVSCTDGECIDAYVRLELHNGTAWGALEGNLTNASANPVFIGNFSGTREIDFTVVGTTFSSDNLLRCAANSTYSAANGTAKNVSVLDVVPPQVTLASPANGSLAPQTLQFAYTPTDLHLANCSLWGNWTGVWARNATAVPVNATQNTFTATLPLGVHLWNVECADLGGNAAFAAGNMTLEIAADLRMHLSIVGSIIEGNTVTLVANVTSNASREETVIVQFWDGAVQLGGNVTLLIPPLDSNATNMTVVLSIGTKNFSALADPPEGSGAVREYDETNNRDNRTVLVSMWQVYFGNFTANVTLAGPSNDTLIEWIGSNSSGNIYVSDTDTAGGISFVDLHPVGRDTAGGRNSTTDDDFSQIDTLLGTGSYEDSVNSSYTSEGNPVKEELFTIFSNDRTVAVINSTGSGEFTTGLLWDASDSSDAQYDVTDKEDIVFVVRVREQVASTNGIVDYEISIPAALKGYRGTQDTVTFYYEVR